LGILGYTKYNSYKRIITMNDKNLMWILAVLLVIPIAFSIMSRESFRYPCQNPENWDKQICKLPTCDVTRTCPEHIFKGQRDPRLGPPPDQLPAGAKPATPVTPATGACK
jgi:hypothetical protein